MLIQINIIFSSLFSLFKHENYIYFHAPQLIFSIDNNLVNYSLLDKKLIHINVMYEHTTKRARGEAVTHKA